MNETKAANRERQQFLKKYGWDFIPIRPKNPSPKGIQYFRYPSLEIMKPQISVYLE